MEEEKNYNPPTSSEVPAEGRRVAGGPESRSPSDEQTPEKLEYLKREEIRTIQKDIAVLREEEARKERERIAALAPEGKKPKPEEELPEGVETKKEAEAVSLVPKLVKRPAPLKKLLIRVLISLLFLAILGFLVWSFWQKPPSAKLPPEQPEEEITTPEIPVPPSLFFIENVTTLEITNNEQILNLLSNTMGREINEGSFLRVVIKNTTENKLISLEDLEAAFQIEAPTEIYQKLEQDFTLAIFAQKDGKRIVFTGKVKEKEGLLEILKAWENKIAKEELFVSGKKITTLVPYFRTASYKNIGFRYLSISKEDLGLCYAWFDDYFVITSSFESMKRVIDEIKAQELDKNVGQLFIVGFDGQNLNPQIEEFFKTYKPGGVLLLSKNIESEEQLKTLIQDLQSLSLREAGFPLFIAIDQEGGLVSRIEFLEEKTPQSEIENIEAAYQIGLTRGQELKELGVNLNLAPLLDFIQEGDFLFERSFQKLPENIGRLAKSIVAGQKKAGILTAIKHFPGYQGIAFNPEEKLAQTQTTPPISQFKKAMEANPEMIMISNVIYGDIDSLLPFTFSPSGIQFLKNNLGTDILITSDDLDQNSLLEKFTLKEIVIKPIEAGVDVMIFSGYRLPAKQGLEAFLSAFEKNEVQRAKVRETVSKIINFKKNNL